ncbi:hypothetical protein NQZ71_25250 (plasmid) [Niallia taxi]|uniref:YesK family protein n=1 Tax=Niallia taxi TaxID=2499688 RepID=UPI0023A91816|nr:YesK family protein [Niallia taxi]MDE5052945.1 YesK family protein [Niallia taxi]WOD65212.1 hypothetical protein NQZ71_25250 [Niallia taxi]
MFFMPFYMGITVGLIIYLLAFIFRKNKKSSIALIPGYIGVIAGLVLFLYGYMFIRGFEGAAYSMMGVPILIISIISIFSKKPKTEPHQH